MTNKKRALALFTALAFCFLVLFSSVYIIVEADHDCSGENCRICYQISVYENTLKTTFNPATGVYVALTFVLLLCLSVFCANIRPQSLITLKVKLSN